MATLAAETWPGTSGPWPAQWTSLNSFGTVSINASSQGQLVTVTDAFGWASFQLLSGMAAVVDQDITFDFTIDSGSTESYFLVAFRSDGSSSQFYPNGYMVQVNPAAGGFQLFKYVGGSQTGATGVTTYAIPSAPTRTSMRIRAFGAAIQVRLWPTLSAEPSTWLLDITDTTTPYLTAGKVQINLSAGSAGGARTATVDNLVVTDGAAALPIPDLTMSSIRR